MRTRDTLIASLSLTAVAALGCGSTVTSGGGGETSTGSTTITTTTVPTTTTSETSSGTTTTSDTGSTTTTSSTTTSSTTTTTTPPSGGAQPPPPGPQNPPDGNGSFVFAVQKVFIGDTDRNGLPNQANGWKQYGFNIDSDISTAMSTNLCKPRNNAPPKNVYPDGDNGIDNSFGRNILPIALGLSSNFSANVNQAIADGASTYLFDLENLGAGADYGPIISRVYRGSDLGGAPQWNGNDAWPIRSDSLASSPDLASALVQTANGYVVDNTWVARFTGKLMVTLDSAGFDFVLPIHNPTIVMVLDAQHQSATFGTISGVIGTDEMIAELQKIAGAFDPTFCEPTNPTFQSIAAQVAQASDILIDGSQDPTKQCDGISVGLGFDAHRVKLGPVVNVTPPPNPCAP